MQLDGLNINFEYIKNKLVLSEINFSFSGGDFVAVLGTNGAGKSTLIKCLASINKINSGEIKYNGENINKLNSKEKAKLISYVPQSINFPDVSVYDAILIGRRPYINFELKESDYKMIDSVIHSFNLQNLAFKKANQISGGEKQKVAIARAIVQEPSIILFDEPTSSLDVNNQLDVLDLISKITKENNLISIMIIHDINLALRFANKFMLMKGGKIIKLGNVEIINKENLDLTYNVNSKIINFDNNKIVIFNKKENI